MAVNGSRFEAVAEFEDERRSHAAHLNPAEHASAVQRAHWIHRPFCRITKNAVPVPVENEAVQVHRTACGVLKHPVPVGVSDATDAKVGLGLKHTLEGREIVELYGKIEIRVRPRLLAEERINSPTAVDPEGEALPFEAAAQIDQMLKVHERGCIEAWRATQNKTANSYVIEIAI